MPADIAFLLEEYLAKNEFHPDEKIWPVIWDFAGQDIYRAIHPIFMSTEDNYLLVFDLTKKLSEKAVCRVNVGHKEHAVTARDDEDTNLDHLLRWMDLIHSLKKGNQKEKECISYPPVILVGTHADCVDSPSKEMELVKQKCSRVFCKHSYLPLIKVCLSIDNTKAGKSVDQEEMENLREKILDIADKTPTSRNRSPCSGIVLRRKLFNRNGKDGSFSLRNLFVKILFHPTALLKRKMTLKNLCIFCIPVGQLCTMNMSMMKRKKVWLFWIPSG